MCLIFKELVHLSPDQLDLISQLWISCSLDQATIKQETLSKENNIVVSKQNEGARFHTL